MIKNLFTTENVNITRKCILRFNFREFVKTLMSQAIKFLRIIKQIHGIISKNLDSSLKNEYFIYLKNL